MDLEPYSAWIRLGRNNILTDLYPPIMDYVPDLPNDIISPNPVEPTSEYWFLTDEEEGWMHQM